MSDNIIQFPMEKWWDGDFVLESKDHTVFLKDYVDGWNVVIQDNNHQTICIPVKTKKIGAVVCRMIEMAIKET